MTESDGGSRVRFYENETEAGSQLSPAYNQSVLQELLFIIDPKRIARVVDLGSGVGSNLPTLRRLCTQAQIVSLDLNWTALAQGLHKLSAVMPAQADAASIPLATSSVDLVVCTEVLEHVEDMKLVFREMSRVLKAGGWALISSPNYLNPMGMRKWLKDRALGKSFWDPWDGHPGFERLMLPWIVAQAYEPYFATIHVRGAGYLMAWIPLGYRRIGPRNDRYPLQWIGRLPVLRHLAMNRYLLLRKS